MSNADLQTELIPVDLGDGVIAQVKVMPWAIWGLRTTVWGSMSARSTSISNAL
jgi:hypothetical protein